MALNFVPQLQNCGSFRSFNSLQLNNTLASFSLNLSQFPKSKCSSKPGPLNGWSCRSISHCLRAQMADDEAPASSSSGEKLHLVDLKLPTLDDDYIKSQVQKTHVGSYPRMLFQPLFLSIQHIIKPTTDFVDSILLEKEVGIEIESSNLFEIISALSELRKLRDVGYFGTFTLKMSKIADKAKETLDEINLHEESMIILQILSNKSWNEKAVMTMGSFGLKFVDLLEFLLQGPNQSSTAFVSSMAALKKNPVSIMESPFKKFEQSLDELNRLVKITLELIQYTCDLTLLYDKEELVSTAVHWAILSAVAGYIQTVLIMDKGEVALDLSHVISNISYILKAVKHEYTIQQPQIEALLEEILDDEPNPSAEISSVTKTFTHFKDDKQEALREAISDNGKISTQLPSEISQITKRNIQGFTKSIDNICRSVVQAISFPFKHWLPELDYIETIAESVIAEEVMEEMVTPMLPKLYSKYAPVALVETVQSPSIMMERQSQVPSSGFQGLLAMAKLNPAHSTSTSGNVKQTESTNQIR